MRAEPLRGNNLSSYEEEMDKVELSGCWESIESHSTLAAIPPSINVFLALIASKVSRVLIASMLNGNGWALAIAHQSGRFL
jgi:hypothetical protein